MQMRSSQRDIARDRQYFDLIEASTKKILDMLKKQKNTVARNELSSKWDRFNKGFQQYIKTKDPITLQLNPLIQIFCESFRANFNDKMLNEFSEISTKSSTNKVLETAWEKLKADTTDFWSFLKVKANMNVTMGSRNTLSFNKYLEEFPGLVHFIYIDRSKHLVTMPAVDFTSEDSIKLTKRKIWAMVKFARDHVQQGHLTIMWKDSGFNYAYFLWFEDASTGMPIRAKNPPSLPWDESFTQPGIISGDFYKRLISECFHGAQNYSKIKCLELFCVHLGLATSSCVLQHSKRLATEISEIATDITSDLL